MPCLSTAAKGAGQKRIISRPHVPSMHWIMHDISCARLCLLAGVLHLKGKIGNLAAFWAVSALSAIFRLFDKHPRICLYIRAWPNSRIVSINASQQFTYFSGQRCRTLSQFRFNCPNSLFFFVCPEKASQTIFVPPLLSIYEYIKRLDSETAWHMRVTRLTRWSWQTVCVWKHSSKALLRATEIETNEVPKIGDKNFVQRKQ